MKSEKLGLVNLFGDGDYTLVNTNLFPYDDKSEEPCKKFLIIKDILKEHKALEIIKVLFKGRARLYTRNDGIEQTIDKNGNYHKTNCVVCMLEFCVGSVHYEFHLHKDEYNLLKEVLL